MPERRPVNLDLRTIRLPITAVVSILHRISGLMILPAIGLLLALLSLSLSDEDGFNIVRDLLGSTVGKFILWTILVAMIYHLVAGVRHLLMDLGIGESLEGGILGAKVVLGATALLVLLVLVWMAF